MSQEPIRVLVVDDEKTVRRSLARVLRFNDFEVATAGSGAEALAAVRAGYFDAVVSDISMPEMDGVELLARLKALDTDLPVVLVTAYATLDSAKRAVAHSAFRYVEKPVRNDELIRIVEDAASLRRAERLKDRALESAGIGKDEAAGLGTLENVFQRGLTNAWMAYQPIVEADSGAVFGYEALLRSSEPRMSTPLCILQSAERLGRVVDVGRRVRTLAPQPWLNGRTSGVLFVNLHPAELLDEELLSPGGSLARIAGSVVLEITERASLDGVGDLEPLVKRLRNVGYRLAVDDLGSGYAGLNSFARLRPEFVKLDMQLVRGVDTNELKQQLLRSMAEVCHKLGIRMVAEGVETEAERMKLVELGADLIQGYLVGRPAPLPRSLAA